MMNNQNFPTTFNNKPVGYGHATAVSSVCVCVFVLDDMSHKIVSYKVFLHSFYDS